MSFKCGIVGLPNVGKSTLFNALTNSKVAALNFPFCTINPNVKIVSVPDIRLIQLNTIINSKKLIPSTIQFIDIAGLIKGAAKGQGLGNKFLDCIRNTDVIIHVVRFFKDNNIIHISGKVNPKKDINVINDELILADLNHCKKLLNNKNLLLYKEEYKIFLKKCELHLQNFNMLYYCAFNENEKKFIKNLNFLTFKPMIYVLNINEKISKKNVNLIEIYKIAKKENTPIILIQALLEEKISNIKNKNDSYFNKFMIKKSALNNLIHTCYSLLKLHTYFTIGIKEIRSWTIPINSTALYAARKIHSDIQKGFIRANIISFSDYIFFKDEKKIKKLGKLRSEGKNYIMQDGDIVHFLFKN